MGVILSSVLLGKAAIYDNKNAIQTQSYGPEQRGSRVKSDLIISNTDAISFPSERKVNILIAFSNDAYLFYKSNVKESGFQFINSDLIKGIKESDYCFLIPASSLAYELKNERLLNVIMIGALVKKTKIVSREAILKSISETISSRFSEINLVAFNRGFNYLS